jgi:hypothetical protein
MGDDRKDGNLESDVETDAGRLRYVFQVGTALDLDSQFSQSLVQMNIVRWMRKRENDGNLVFGEEFDTRGSFKKSGCLPNFVLALPIQVQISFQFPRSSIQALGLAEFVSAI